MGRWTVILHVVVSEDNIVKLYLNPVWYLEEESSRQRSNTYKTSEMRVCVVAQYGERQAVCLELCE